MRLTLTLVFILILAFGTHGFALAQDEPAAPGPPTTALSATVLRVAPPVPEGAWLELTHLPSEAPPAVVDLERAAAELADPEAPFVVDPGLPPGPALLCTGAKRWAVLCERVYRGGEGEAFAAAEIEVTFALGVISRGTLRQDGLPIPGARVAVVPAGLESPRAFLLPLGGETREELTHEVVTGDDGVFELPALAAGEYFIEAVLPSGRVFRGEPFVLPDAVELGQEFGLSAEELLELGLVWDLGSFDVPPGLTVDFVAVDLEENPLAGVRVEALQGRTPRELLRLAGETKSDGRASLSGFDPALPARFSCEKEGYRPHVVDAEDLLPVEVRCVLEPWAAVFGDVITPDGTAPAKTTVSARRLDGTSPEASEAAAAPPGTAAPPRTAAATADGLFELLDLAAGEYELRVAAPGFATEELSFAVDPGERLDLGTVALLFGRQLPVRVVDRETGERLAGVEVVALDPPGAAAATSDVEGELTLTLGDAPMTVRFSTVDYAPLDLEIDPAAFAEDEDLVVPLEPAGFILVEIQGESGPCSGCRVEIRPGGEQMATDSRGEALSGPLLPGVYQVVRPRLSHLGSTVIEEPDAAAHRVRVTAGEVTRLRLAPLDESVLVRFEPPLEDGPYTLSARSARRAQKVHPGNGGEFARDEDFVVDLSGEPLDLYLHRFDPATGQERVVWQGTLPARPRDDVFRVRRSRAVIEGRAVGPGRQPRAGAEVRLLDFVSSAFRGYAATDANGVFRLPDVPPGIYTLMIGPRNVHFVSLRERQELDLGTFELFLDP